MWGIENMSNRTTQNRLYRGEVVFSKQILVTSEKLKFGIDNYYMGLYFSRGFLNPSFYNVTSKSDGIYLYFKRTTPQEFLGRTYYLRFLYKIHEFTNPTVSLFADSLEDLSLNVQTMKGVYHA